MRRRPVRRTGSSCMPASTSARRPASRRTSRPSASATSTSRRSSRREREAATATTSSITGASGAELGGEDGFDALVETLRQHGLGVVLDLVPNHVGIGQGENHRWLDVLEYGRSSPYADWFDIDWDPPKPELRGRVLLPFLGDLYGHVLERGELSLAFDAGSGSLCARYYDHSIPLSPRTYPRVLQGRKGAGEEALPAALEAALDGFSGLARVRGRSAFRERAEALKAELRDVSSRDPEAARFLAACVSRFSGTPGQPASFGPLHALLEAQSWRLAYWRVAADEINYRRFFNINDLAGLRVEREDVFEATHALVLRWVREGRVDGLRIDHVDGLFDPRGYCDRLQRRTGSRPLWIVVEKILAGHESLPAAWPVAGTTGYDFLNQVNGLFVDPDGEAPLLALYEEICGEPLDFDEIAYAARKHVVNFLLNAELQVLSNELDRISESRWDTRDFTLVSLREALKEVVACFPVYRTYVDGRGARSDDRRTIEWAVRVARGRSADPEGSLFEAIGEILTADFAKGLPRAFQRDAVRRFAMHFQQFSGPVMAKGIEDTTFYRRIPLLSLNEVGGDPRRFGVSVQAFHHLCRERAKHWPASLLATATHDTKRGEDVRTRLDVLSEIPSEWAEQVRRWFRLNASRKREVEDRPAPEPVHEYLLYQTLVGSWPAELSARAPDAPSARGPAEPLDAAALAIYRERVEGYLVKALREAKTRSSWRHPNEPYEQACLEFLGRLLDAESQHPFLGELAAFSARVAGLARPATLAQAALKLTVPGVPDVYQGCELTDLALADPDNRRPVDFVRRKEMLSRVLSLEGGAAATDGALQPSLAAWSIDELKLLVTARLLRLRSARAALFRDGAYLPLEVHGKEAERSVAFARHLGDEAVVVVAPRLCAGLVDDAGRLPPGTWGDTAVRLPAAWRGSAWRDAVTERAVSLPAVRGEAALPLDLLYEQLPLAVLVGEPGPCGDRPRER